MFAAITPALITGAFAERKRFGSFVLFTIAWSILIYSPIAHWVWSVDGWLFKLGALDFAGGTVVHISSGVSALVVALMIGRRAVNGDSKEPHDVPMTVLGAGLLWFGWFGFNAGSAVTAGGLAASAFTVTNIAAAAATVTWVLASYLHTRKVSVVGAACGAVAGLVAITPASGYVTAGGALVIGLVAGGLCYSATLLRARSRVDDALDVFAVHGVGGMFGAVATGIFASSTVQAAYSGLLDGNPQQLVTQLIAVGATIGYAAVGTVVIVKVVDLLLGIRVKPAAEEMGLDLSVHGEAAYQRADPSPAPPSGRSLPTPLGGGRPLHLRRPAIVSTSSPSTQPPADPPLYDARFEHDACGVGFVADAGGHTRDRVLPLALTGLASLAHRGAFGADGESSDGAGVALPLDAILALADAPARRRIGSASRASSSASCRDPVRRPSVPGRSSNGSSRRPDCGRIGWRVVPSDPAALGGAAARPARHSTRRSSSGRHVAAAIRARRATPPSSVVSSSRGDGSSARPAPPAASSPRPPSRPPRAGRSSTRASSPAPASPTCTRTCGRRCRWTTRSSTSAMRPTRIRSGGSPSRSARSPITARSTRSAATASRSAAEPRDAVHAAESPRTCSPPARSCRRTAPTPCRSTRRSNC